MRLTTADVARFVGGQMEIQNQGERYMYRGEIATIVVEENQLRVTFAWLGKAEGYPPFPTRWVRDDQLKYTSSLQIYSASDIGPGSEGGDRICLQSTIVGETVVLFPPNGSKLDRSRVEGLDPVTA